MTEDLLHQLEEKMMMLLSEVEALRGETQRLQHENTTMKTERENHARKLNDMLSLLDVVHPVEAPLVNMGVPVGAVKFHEETLNS